MELGELRGLLWDLQSDPDGATARLKARLAEDALSFIEAAADLVAEGVPRTGEQVLRNILRDGSLTAALLSNPGGPSLEDAARVAAKVLRVEPAFDLQLAQWLVRQPRPPVDCQSRKQRVRGIDLLRKIGTQARLAAFQGQFLRETDPNVRSKAAQMMAEVTRDAVWFRTHLADHDPRVRANTIETLWESDWDQAVALFDLALADAHHRVITTALVGLAKAGQQNRAVEELLRLAEDPRPEFRAAAAWAMETIPDQRFRSALMILTRDPAPTVRPRAFAALRAIERRKSRPPSGEEHIPVRQPAPAAESESQVVVEASM